MADLSRTFASSGESDSKAPPETSIDMPASIMPVMEFCRPISRVAPPASSILVDESFSRALSNSVPAGGPALSTPLIGLRRGIWRIFLQASFVCTGAAPDVGNYAMLGLVGPGGLFETGLHLLAPAQNGVVTGVSDFIMHLPTDEWTISIELPDPVTALATNRLRGSVYACHLL
jgi:hypothetical protein